MTETAPFAAAHQAIGAYYCSNFEPTMSMMRPRGISAVLMEFGSQPLPPMPPDTPKKWRGSFCKNSPARYP
jgi:hypothetical protein